MFEPKPLVEFNSNTNYSPFKRAAQLGAAGAAFITAHRAMMRFRPDAAGSLYNFFHQLEERSPGHILRTFGLSQLYSSYLPVQLTVPKENLFVGERLSEMGEHFNRLFGGKVDLRAAGDLNFARSANGSSYMDLVGTPGAGVRFYKKGKISSSSSRLGAPLRAGIPFELPKGSIRKMGPVNWVKAAASKLYKTQAVHGYDASVGKGLIEGVSGFQPGSARFAGNYVKNVGSSAEQFSFLMLERMQSLLSDVGLGLKAGTYNRPFHIPLMGGKNKGLVNELLTKRALPFYLTLGVALPFADYLTKHRISNAGINLYQKARIAHAELTDKTPLRGVTNWYADAVSGAQYGPLALPVLGATAGLMYHGAKVAAGKLTDPVLRATSSRIFARGKAETFLGIFNRKSPVALGLIAGIAVAIPFIPGMLGSRKSADQLRDIYSGQEPVAIRSGRWWDLGTTPWEGNRIQAYRPHWSVLFKSQAEKKSLYGSEDAYWQHHPLLHPLRWLKDPYWLEKQHYQDRPYPVTSPAFSNVPLIGPILASTVGKLFKPPVRMHKGEWGDQDYTLYSPMLEPRGPRALPPPKATEEFQLRDLPGKEASIFADFIGLPGFIATTLYNRVFPDKNMGKDIRLQGSRQMQNTSRRYYEKELGAGAFLNRDLSGYLGYSEPLRRFIQPEKGLAQVNEIPNTMPDWLPGEDYFTNFKVGDPYIKVDEGYARLPGAGYEALHPELEGVNPEDYPDITKLSILGDVAPYSSQYRSMEAHIRRQAATDTETQIEYEKIRERVRQMKNSVLRTDDRRFSEEIAQTSGTISRVSKSGIELEQYPGRVFKLSSLGYTAADLSAAAIAEDNHLTRAQVAGQVNLKQQKLVDFFNERLSPGTSVDLTIPKSALETSTEINAVFSSNGSVINKELIDEGLAIYRRDNGGPEAQVLFGPIQRALGKYAEELAFTGDEKRWNPLRYIPSPGHSKLWQERTALSQYQQQEIEGARLRRWQRPIHDFLNPYIRGTYRRVVGDPGIPSDIQKKRDFNTMTDMLNYLRDLQQGYTNKTGRTAIGANLFGDVSYVASTLPDRDSTYFPRLVKETNPKIRKQILAAVPTEMSNALVAQWTAQEASIARTRGEEENAIGQGGRPYSDDVDEYRKAGTALSYGDYERSKEVAEFFSTRGLHLPEDPSSEIWNPDIDFEDVKLKIIQQEGYDAHDFGIFDDRSALLWRKPYIDGAVRELTSRDSRSTEQMRRAVEELIVRAHDKNPKVITQSNPSSGDQGTTRIDIDLDQTDDTLKDMRRNPEKYK